MIWLYPVLIFVWTKIKAHKSRFINKCFILKCYFECIPKSGKLLFKGLTWIMNYIKYNYETILEELLREIILDQVNGIERPIYFCNNFKAIFSTQNTIIIHK